MALGPLWYVLNPLFSMALYTLIFGVVAKLATDGVPYPIFNDSALLRWNYFLGAVNGAVNSLFMHRDLIPKVCFPRLVVPLVGVLSGLVDLAIQFVSLLGMMVFYGRWPRWAIEQASSPCASKPRIPPQVAVTCGPSTLDSPRSHGRRWEVADDGEERSGRRIVPKRDRPPRSVAIGGPGDAHRPGPWSTRRASTR